MNYITDYQLDIDRGFHYKIQDHINLCEFRHSKTTGLWYINGFTVLTRALDICWNDLLKKFTNCKIIDYVFFCNSKEQCYDLCQHIVAEYFKPINVSHIKECSEKSRKHLNSYYRGTEQVNFPNGTFILKLFDPGGYYWSGTNPNLWSRDMYGQFELSTKQVLEICNNLKLQVYFASKTLVFNNKESAIKFTDYLIETYIIKKEKTYDTNQLRKERTSIRRGVEPAGRIIHGRRSKASVRCRHIEHKACVGCYEG